MQSGSKLRTGLRSTFRKFGDDWGMFVMRKEWCCTRTGERVQRFHRASNEVDDCTSKRKSSMLIECMRRNVCCVGRGSGVELIDLVKIWK